MIANQDDFPNLDKLIAEAPEAGEPTFTVLSPPTPSGELTMSSLQIAEITGKDHKNVMRDIRDTLEQAEIGALKFERTYTDSQNKDRPCYILPRRECDLVVSGYSVKYRLAIIDRWHELEAAPVFQIPQTYAEALRLSADLVEEVGKLKTTVSEMAPKAAALERIADGDGLMNITVAAKTLQVRPKVLFTFLDTHGWTYRRAGNSERIPYQAKISQGYLTMKAHSYINANTGEDQVSERTLITPKGLAKLGEILATLKTA